MGDDIALWRRFEAFLWNFQLGYFTDCQLRLPWGLWVLSPNAHDDSLVWRGDAGFGAKEMAAELAATGAKLGVAHYGVYLSPSWRGDVAVFAAQLQEIGWRNSFSVHWLVRYLSEMPPSVDLPDAYLCEIMNLADSGPLPGLREAEALVEGKPGDFPIFTAPRFSQGVARFAAIIRLAATREIVGYGLAAHDGDFGYLYALGVVPAHRNRGLAKALVAARWRALHAAGVRTVMTAVVTQNAASLRVQESQGYRIFATAHAWQPEGQGSGAYEVEEGLQARD